MFGVFLEAKIKASVRGPSFPTIMSTIIVSFPIPSRLPVIPIDSPTVPNADTTSNKFARKGEFCVSSRMKTPTRTTPVEITVMASALIITEKASVL